MELRPYLSTDVKEIVTLFQECIQHTCTKDYNQNQINVWVNHQTAIEKWDEILSSHTTLVALIDHQIVGFGDIDNNGHLDHLFVHYKFQHLGIATRLCDELEKNFKQVTTFASITAYPFFIKRNYILSYENTVVLDQIELKNYKLVKYN